MAYYNIPQSLDRKSRTPTLYHRHLCGIYNTIGVIGVAVFLFGVATTVFSGKLSPGLTVYSWISLKVGAICIAAGVSVWMHDWRLLDKEVRKDWRKVEARVISAEVVPFQLTGHGLWSGSRNVPARSVQVTAIVPLENEEREVELIVGPQIGWHEGENPQEFLNRRIRGGRCVVALEPGSGHRAFLLPWETPFRLCNFFVGLVAGLAVVAVIVLPW
jgi:hypothetical protein